MIGQINIFNYLVTTQCLKLVHVLIDLASRLSAEALQPIWKKSLISLINLQKFIAPHWWIKLEE